MKKELNFISCQRKYIGVGFIKSRKSEGKIMEMGEEMIAKAKSSSVELLEVIVDGSSGNDADLQAIDKLAAWMEKGCIDVVVVRSIFDITRDVEDLKAFMRKAEKLNVSIYDMERGMNLAYIPQDSGGW